MEKGEPRNVINEDKELLRHRIGACRAFAKFRDALLLHLPEGSSSRTCKNVHEMGNALLQLNNDVMVGIWPAWKQWNEEYVWCLQLIQVLTTVGGAQRFAWVVRERALLYLEDSERDGCKRAAAFLEQLSSKAREKAAVFFAAGNDVSYSFRTYQDCTSRHLRLQCEAAIVAGDHFWITHSAPVLRRRPRFFYKESGCTTPYAPSDSTSESDTRVGTARARACTET